MRPFSAFLIGLCLTVSVAGDDALVKFADVKRIEADYSRAVAEIEADSSKRMGVAEDARLKEYRAILSAVTKTGDFDKASAIRDRIREYEEAASAGKIAKPGVLKIISATYGVNQSWFDVTDALAKKIGTKNSWTSDVSDDDWGDPAPNYTTGNTLVVRYSFRGKVSLKAEYQGRRISLP